MTENDFEAWRSKLEPEADAFKEIDTIASVSLAISMKRIADEICGTPQTYGIARSIYEAIETAIVNATRR